MMRSTYAFCHGDRWCRSNGVSVHRVHGGRHMRKDGIAIVANVGSRIHGSDDHVLGTREDFGRSSPVLHLVFLALLLVSPSVTEVAQLNAGA